MSLAAANLTAPNMPTFEKMSPLIEALRKGSDNFQSQIIKFVILLDPWSDGNINYMRFVHDKPCDYVDLDSLGITNDNCMNIVGDVFQKSPLSVMAWMKSELPGIVQRIQLIKTNTDPFDFIKSNAFLRWEYVR